VLIIVCKTFTGAIIADLAERLQFGRWSWVANGVLFACFHVHQPWTIAENIVSGAILAYPSWRFRSTWMAVIVHSAQNVFFGFLVLGLVLGLA
jgi:CAAX amino terminal protease family.